VLAAKAARADGTALTSSLSFTRSPGSESCISAVDLARAVEKRLRRRVFESPSVAALSIEGQVEATREPPGWRAVIRAAKSDGTALGTRELSSGERQCSALDRSLVLVIAQLIDPDAELDPPAAVAQPRAGRFSLGAHGNAATGVLPELAVGGDVAFGFRALRALALEFRGGIWASQTSTRAEGGGHFALADAFIGACTPFELGAAFEVGPCAGVRIGWLRSRGVDLDATEENSWLVEPTLGFRASLKLSHTFAFEVGGGAFVNAVRPHFRYQEVDGSTVGVYQVPDFGGIFSVGLALAIPR
jgi:hypothetical protein